MTHSESTTQELPAEQSYQAGLRTTTITAEQKRKWDDTVSMMTWTAPGFLHLLYKLLNAQGNTDSEHVAIWSEDIPTAATDGLNVIINPKWYFGMTLPERTYVLGHEIIHNVYDDVALLHRCMESGKVIMPDGSTLPFDEPTMQKAMDVRINALLTESRIGQAPKEGHFDKAINGSASVYDAYKKYYKKKPEGKGDQPGKPDDKPGSNRGGNNPGGFDGVMKPGQATGANPQKVAKRDEQRWAVEIAQAQQLERHNSKGDLPASMEKMFKEILEPEIPWTDHIEALVKRQVGDGGVDWTRPHPWWGAYDFYVPDETGYGAGWIVVWGDTSGSVFDDGIQARNIGELAGVIDQVKPSRLTLLWCDSQIREGSVLELDEGSDLRDLKPVGGGGTNYKPVLDWIAKNNHGETPDLFIGFTDGYVSFPKDGHPFPTIWASSTKEGVVKYPFGQVVYINDVRR